jgi:hypothetical protein
VYIEIVDSRGAPEEARFDRTSKPSTFRVINRFQYHVARHGADHCEPFVMPHDSWLNSGNSTDFIRNNPRRRVGLPIHRLARKILGATVGVALGGGAAFGIAHLGVLQVLEKHGIPIDLIAGCSQVRSSEWAMPRRDQQGGWSRSHCSFGHWKNSLLAVDLTTPALDC